MILFQHVLNSQPIKGASYKAKRENKLFEIEVPGEYKKSDDNHVFGERTDKLVYRSQRVQPATSYVVAVVRPGAEEVHLAPVDHVVQFRPTFNYLDNDKETKAVQAERDDPGTSSQSEAEAEDQVHAVTMRFAGAYEDRIKKARERSYAHFQQQQASEEWTDMTYYSNTTEQSVQARKSLACRQPGRAQVIRDQSPSKSPTKDSRRRSVQRDDDSNVISGMDDFLRALKCKSTAIWIVLIVCTCC